MTKRLVVLLRGVNVGGANVIKMVELADVVRRLGYDDVKTVLASGNVLLTTADSADVAKEKLETALRGHFGYQAWVHVLTQDAVADIVAAYPFPRAGDRHAYVVFVVNPDVRRELLAIPLDPAEQVSEGHGVLYWSVPKGSTLDSPMGKAQGSSKHKQWLTTRNLNTLEKLAG